MIRMQERSFNIEGIQRGRQLRLVLIFFVLFALWHVAQHGARDIISTDTGSDCQVCRLAHAPAAGGALALTVATVFVFSQLIVTIPSAVPRTLTYIPGLARGPPPV